MPLRPGAPPSVTIPELHSGKTFAHTEAKFGKQRAQKQAIAIALSNERKGRAMGGGLVPNMPSMIGGPMGKAMAAPLPSMTPTAAPVGMGTMANNMGVAPRMMNNGGVAERAFGGAGMVKTPGMTPTWQERQEARNMTRGPILSAVPGRTDAHFTHVPSGSYVIPADIVSGRGEGNTLAGANTLQKMFKMGPYGSGMPKLGGHSSMPRPPKLGALASGGGKYGNHVGKPVKVKLAGGEIVVPPEHVLETMQRVTKRKLSLDEAHRIMDAWILNERKKLRKTLAGLPGPAKD